ncbi:MAG: CvpA family protein [bacterium]|nr:CvpA family protein [bacterium]
MNVIDVVIVLMILCAGIVGFKRGFFKQLVLTVGILIVCIVSFKLKDPIANFLSLYLPFFKFGGNFYKATALNIILYQAIAFIIVFSLVMIIFRIILAITGAFEKILKFTIILSIPSKIAGFILGLIEGYILMFIVLFMLDQPLFNNPILDESKLMRPILSSSPILSSTVESTNNAIIDIYDLQKDFLENKDVNKYNDDIIDILLKYNIIDNEYLNKLKEKGKI